LGELAGGKATGSAGDGARAARAGIDKKRGGRGGMKKEVMNILGIAVPDSPFNHVVRAGKTLYLTSQLSADLKTGEIIKGNITEQTRRALENIKFLLESSGSSMDNIVKAVVYMRDVTKFNEMDKVYRGYFKKGLEPARTTIQAPSPIQDIDVEIEVTATL
jgi:2-iminobutanoate/2-iminopropanoate deaminase